MVQLKQAVRNLSVDSHLSSSEIFNRVIKEVQEFLFRQGGFSAANWGDVLIDCINIWVTEHPNLFKLYHFLNHILILLQTKRKDELSSTEALAYVRDYIEFWEPVANKVTNNFIDAVDLNDASVLLHGDNVLIHQLFKKLADYGVKPNIYQTVTRPTMEGKNQAKILAGLGFDVSYIEDVTVGKFVSLIDVFISGADGIRKNHFINKAGTLMISLACERFKKPHYVLCDSRNIMNEAESSPELIRKLTAEPPKNADAMWAFPPNGVVPISYYYDTTPSNIIDKFVLEFGVFDPEQIEELDVSYPVSSLLDISY